MDIRRIAWVAGALSLLGWLGCDSPDASGDSEADTDAGSETTGEATTNPPPGDPASGPGDDGGPPPGGDGTDSGDDGPAEEDGGSDDGEPPTSDCCEVRDAPSCEDEAVALCVCDEMTECCVSGWTQECVDLAADTCGACDGGGDPAGCAETHVLELTAAEAELSGGWFLTESMVGEGTVAVIDFPFETDAVLWSVEIPCNDTWHIWVRHFEEQDFDSYFVRLDGEPMQRAIFEADCTPMGQGYGWKELNQRDEFGPPCTYVEDPWAPMWTAGAHELEFSFRESRALARVVVTNDAGYAP